MGALHNTTSDEGTLFALDASVPAAALRHAMQTLTAAGVLEMILTAPVVVASWISMQYYGAVVAPDVFGGGNKLLHNVTGDIGVVEGNGGALRGGLPLQSVHDGRVRRNDRAV